jgi:ATP synthase protein I
MTDGPDSDMHDRLAKLGRDLDARANGPQAKAATPTGPDTIGSAMSTGFRVMSEFVAAVAVGGLIGWQCDRWFGTSPFLLILFIGLGVAAGMWTIYRTASKPTHGIGQR